MLVVEYAAGPVLRQVTLRLHQGLNMVALPVQPADPSIAAVTAPIADKLVRVWAHDAWDSVSPWSYYEPGMESELASLELGRGYWFDMAADGQLTIRGWQQASALIPLHAGRNLIGHPACVAVDMDTVLGRLGDKVDIVWYYDADTPAAPWRSYSPDVPYWVNEVTWLEPGKAYWITVFEDALLRVP